MERVEYALNAVFYIKNDLLTYLRKNLKLNFLTDKINKLTSYGYLAKFLRCRNCRVNYSPNYL